MGFKFDNTGFERGGGGLDLGGGEARGDELGAVPIVGQNINHKDALDLGGMASGRGGLRVGIGMTACVQHFGVTENFLMPARRVIHGKEAPPVLYREAAESDHLPVAAVIGELEFVPPGDAKEARRAAAMVEVGQPCPVRVGM